MRTIEDTHKLSLRVVKKNSFAAVGAKKPKKIYTGDYGRQKMNKIGFGSFCFLAHCAPLVELRF